MMLRIQVLASGSSGNATLVTAGRTSILLDAGIPGTKLAKAVREAGADPDSLAGVFVSHEHSDHIRGLEVFLKRRRVPLFASSEVVGSSRLDMALLHGVEEVRAGCPVEVGALRVTPFLVPHDAASTFGFVLEAGGIRAVQATDMGKPTQLLRERLRGAHCVLLEFNHDLDRLMASHYPLDIKMRIRGTLGHLSNDQAASVVRESLDGEVQALYLMHLSEANNHPSLALLAATEALSGRPPIRIAVAERHAPTEAWEG
jgi:phosphoribosyl 1,2-cyclic phosphodiesterase